MDVAIRGFIKRRVELPQGTLKVSTAFANAPSGQDGLIGWLGVWIGAISNDWAGSFPIGFIIVLKKMGGER